METKELLEKGRSIWGEEKLPLAQILVRMGKVYGDLCRWERDVAKDPASAGRSRPAMAGEGRFERTRARMPQYAGFAGSFDFTALRSVPLRMT